MKKLLLISMLIGALPFTMQAQDDDLYFVPKKKSVEKSVVEPSPTYTDNSRSIDEYNRRMTSSYQVIDGDTTKIDSLRSDIITFNGEKGVYPDSLSEDYELTKKMSRFDDYQLADNAAFWAGYQAGLDTWSWHSPWYYSRYGWYGGWYDPWYSPYYYNRWRYGWYDPWYDPWYYSYYGWYDPWYYGPYGWYDPYYYGWGYRYWGGGYIVGGSGYAHHHIGTGTIRRDGSTYSHRHGGSITGNSERMGSLRDRASRMSGNSGNRTYSSGNNDRSRSGNFGGYRGNTNSSGSRSNAGSYGGGSRSSGSFGGSRSSGGGGGGFSGGGSRGGGGGGGGGGRLGGRR